MTNIIELLEQYTLKNPNTPILFDDAHSKGVTYARLDDMSGRVYAYLKEHGIGKEDFVLLNLPEQFPYCVPARLTPGMRRIQIPDPVINII